MSFRGAAAFELWGLAMLVSPEPYLAASWRIQELCLDCANTAVMAQFPAFRCHTPLGVLGTTPGKGGSAISGPVLGILGSRPRTGETVTSHHLEVALRRLGGQKRLSSSVLYKVLDELL